MNGAKKMLSAVSAAGCVTVGIMSMAAVPVGAADVFQALGEAQLLVDTSASADDVNVYVKKSPSTVAVPVTGRAGVPGDASAVLLDVEVLGDAYPLMDRPVYVVGDSLSVGVSYVGFDGMAADAGVNLVEFDAEVSRSITAAPSVIERWGQVPADAVVMVALGTNDIYGRASTVTAAAVEIVEMLSPAQVVFVNVDRGVPGNPTGVNAALAALARTEPNVFIADWAAEVDRVGVVLAGDDVHYGGDGYRARAEFMLAELTFRLTHPPDRFVWFRDGADVAEFSSGVHREVRAPVNADGTITISGTWFPRVKVAVTGFFAPADSDSVVDGTQPSTSSTSTTSTVAPPPPSTVPPGPVKLSRLSTPTRLARVDSGGVAVVDVDLAGMVPLNASAVTVKVTVVDGTMTLRPLGVVDGDGVVLRVAQGRQGAFVTSVPVASDGARVGFNVELSGVERWDVDLIGFLAP